MSKKLKRLRLISSMVLIFTMLFGTGSVFAKESTSSVAENNVSNATDFVMQQIIETSQSNEESTWSQDTKISEIIPLYNFENNINGYIFNLENTSNPCGYMQISMVENGFFVISYGFNEKHFIYKMIDAARGQQKGIDTNKIIYIGNSDYLVRVSTGKDQTFFNLNTQSKHKINDNKIKEQLHNFTNQVNNECAKKQLSRQSTSIVRATPVKKYVTNATYTDLVIRSDWGYLPYYDASGNSCVLPPDKGGCAPTAGTNLIKYWAKNRTMPSLWDGDDSTICAQLCNTMQINPDTGGVAIKNFVPGLTAYSKKRGVSYISSNTLYGNSCSFNQAKSLIDKNIPFHVAIPGHSVACFGYNVTNDGTQQLIFCNSWTRDWNFQWIGSMQIDSFGYVQWK